VSNYVPTPSTNINLVFLEELLPPLGNDVDLELSRVVLYGELICTTDDILLDLVLYHYIWEKTLNLVVTTDDIVTDVHIAPNEGLWYLVPQQPIVFAFIDDTYTIPGAANVPFTFTPLTVQFKFLKFTVTADNVSIDLELFTQDIRDRFITYTLPTVGLFTAFFARPAFFTWISSLATILPLFACKYIPPRTANIFSTLANGSCSISGIVPIPVTGTLAATLGYTSCSVLGIVPIRIYIIFSTTLDNITPTFSLLRWDSVQGSFDCNTGSCSVIFNLYKAPVGNWLSTTENNTDLFTAVHLVGRLNSILAVNTSIFRTVHIVGILDSNTNCVFYLTGIIPIRIYLTLDFTTGTVIWVPLKEMIAEFSIDYYLDASDSIEHIQDISYFGDARNLFNNVHILTYINDAPNDLPIIQNLNYLSNLTSSEIIVNEEYALEGLADEHNYILQQYSVNLKESVIFEVLEYLVEVSLNKSNVITNSYSNILVSTEYINEISSSIIVEEQTDEAHFYWDLDTINLYQDSYSVNYELQSPTAAIINIVPDTPVTIIRFLVSLGAVIQGFTSSINVEIFLHIMEPKTIDLSFITDDSLFDSRGYSVLKIIIDAHTHNDYSLFSIVTFYGRLSITTASVISVIRGGIPTLISMNLITNKDVSLTTGHFLLTAASNYLVYINIDTGSVQANIFGVGANLGSLFVSGNPNEVYNLTDPITHKILRYWYALGVIFNGMIINPYALRAEIITPMVVCRFVALIPEPRQLTLALNLSPVIFRGRGYIRVTLIFNVILNNINGVFTLGYTNTKLQMDLFTAISRSTLSLTTPIRIYVDFRANTGDIHSDIFIRLSSLGKLQSDTLDSTSRIWGVQMVGTFDVVSRNVIPILELRIPFGITLAGDTGCPLGNIDLKVPIQINIRFDCAFDNALGGFKLRNPIVGSLETTTAFMFPKILISSIIGRLSTVTNNYLYINFYLKHRDLQTLELDLELEDCSSKIKGRIITNFRINLTMSDNYSIIMMKAPIYNVLDFRTSLFDNIPTFVLRNGKATFVIIEKLLPNSIAQIYCYYPLIGFFNVVLNDVFLNLKIKVPERYLVDFTPDTVTAFFDIRMAIPVFGYVNGLIHNDLSYFRGSATLGIMAIFPPAIKIVSFKLSVAVRISVKFLSTLELINFRLNSWVDVVGILSGINEELFKEEDPQFDHQLMLNQQQRSGVTSLFRLFTYVMPTAISGRLLQFLPNVFPNFVLNNPTNGIRFNVYVTAYGNINLVSLVQGEFIIETEDLRSCEIILNLKATSGIITSQLKNSSANFKGSIDIAVFLDKVTELVKPFILLEVKSTRHGSLIFRTQNNTGIFVCKSIKDQYAGPWLSVLDNVKFVLFQLKIPYRLYCVIDSNTVRCYCNIAIHVSCGGRLSSETDSVLPTILSQDSNLRILLITEDLIGKIKLGIAPAVDGLFKVITEKFIVDIHLKTPTSGHLFVVTAPPSLVRFRMNKEIYGKMVPWDYIVSNNPPLYKLDLKDPIYQGIDITEWMFDPTKCDIFKRTAFVIPQIELYTPIPAKIRMNLLPGKEEQFADTYMVWNSYINKWEWGTTRTLPNPWFSASGIVDIFGFMETGITGVKEVLFYLSIKVFSGKWESKLDGVKKTDLRLRNVFSIGFFLEFQTGPATFYIAATATNPSYFAIITDHVNCAIYATAPFFAFCDLESTTESIKIRIVIDVVLYKWAFIFTQTVDSVAVITGLISFSLNRIELITQDIISDILLIEYFILGRMNAYLRACTVRMKINTTGLNPIIGYFITHTDSIIFHTEIYASTGLFILVGTKNATMNFIGKVARPLVIDFYFRTENSLSAIYLVAPISGLLQSNLQDIENDLQLLYIKPIIGHLFSDSDSISCNIRLYIPVYLTLDLILQDIITDMDIRVMVTLTLESILESSVYFGRVNIYEKEVEQISDLYYDIEGEILPDSPTSTFNKKGFVRVYSGETGELVKEVYTTGSTYKIANLIEGEYSVVLDPDVEKRLKVHSKIILGEDA
jgi:hypothetical protein